MGKYLHSFLGFAFLFFIGIQDSYSQFYYNHQCRYTAIGFSLKGSYSDGDIETPLQYVRPGLGAYVVRRVTPRFSYGAELMWIRLMGDDFSGSNLQAPNKIPLYIRNLHFRNDIKELTLFAKYDLFQTADHYRKRPVYNLYAGTGISFFYHNPKAKVLGDTGTAFTKTQWVALRQFETENVKYSNFCIAIPAMVGIRYKLSLQWDMEVEVGYRYTFTDYLDDVGSSFADPSSLKSNKARALSNRSAEEEHSLTGNLRDLDYIQNELGYSVNTSPDYSYVDGFGPGSKRESKKGDDRYIIFSVRFIYAIPGTVNCPKFREF
jgi:hypothetical protein